MILRKHSVRKTPPAKISAQDAHAMLEMMKVKTKEYVQRLKGEHAVETESLRKLVSDSSEEVKTLKEKLTAHASAFTVLKMTLTEIDRDDLWQCVSAVAEATGSNGIDGDTDRFDSILKSQMLQASQTVNKQVRAWLRLLSCFTLSC